MGPELEAMAALCGTWEGGGRGFFPTIATFEYRERLELRLDRERELIELRQLAWKLVPGGEVVSHHEVGVIVVTDTDLVMSTVQNGSRYERLVGAVRREDDVWEIDWRSSDFAADPRMVSSSRRWNWSPSHLRYTMAMQTTAVASELPHLAGELHRLA